MIPLIVGILILIAIFGFFYFMRSGNSKKVEEKEESPKKEIENVVQEKDIVLAMLTERDKPLDYAILWNGTPGKSYHYIIVRDSLEIAKGEISSNTSVFRVRGIPIISGETYNVQVGNTRVKIPFVPPTIIGTTNMGGQLDVETNIVPTDIEVISSTGTTSSKVPLTECQIKMEPPGFLCKFPSETKPTVVIYNGRNAVNILM